MLDKRTTFAMEIITSICKDGSYKIINKQELADKISIKYIIDSAALMQVVNHLQNLQLIDVKYTDDDVVCLALLPKGRLYIEEKSIERPSKLKTSVNYILIFLAAFAGALIGAVIGGLF